MMKHAKKTQLGKKKKSCIIIILLEKNCNKIERVTHGRSYKVKSN